MKRVDNIQVVEKSGKFYLLQGGTEVFSAEAPDRETFLTRIINARDQGDMVVVDQVPAYIRNAMKEMQL